MRRKAPFYGGVFLFACLLAPCSFAVLAYAEGAAHEFVGAKKCGMCHQSATIGKQLQIWQESSHAKAYETLGTDRAKSLASGAGISDPQKDGKCLKCHSSAYGFSEQRVTEQIPVEEGVSCESCHGAGKDYMKLTIMKDRAAAVAAGLVIPDETTCRKCHEAGGPVVKAFNFQESWEKIKHPVPQK